MSDRIEPALSAEEWAEASPATDVTGGFDLDYTALVRDGEEFRREDRHRTLDPAGIVAVANARLGDDDPRKITREWVEHIREAATTIDGTLAADLRAIADALESYLPVVVVNATPTPP